MGNGLESVLRSSATVTDWGRIERAHVRSIAEPQNEQQLCAVIEHARQNQLKVTLRGIGHSAGGQSFCDDALMIDMRQLNQVLQFDEHGERVRIQCGADWGVLTKLLEPRRLAVSTKQEFDTFTIGGSIAANVHGKTVDYGPLIEQIESFRLLSADGRILNVSREENEDLFPAAIGGYGLFGIIVDVTLRLVKDRVVEKTEIVRMNLDALVRSYVDRIRRDPMPPLCYGFLDPTCTKGFYVTYDYMPDPGLTLGQLQRDEPGPVFFNLFCWLQRHIRFIRRRSFAAMWFTSAKPEVTLRSRRLLLWEHAPRAFEDMLLQKYFVPVDKFAEFARRVGKVFGKFGDDLPLLTNHFRFVPGSDQAVLPYAPRDSICMIPCYLARKGSDGWLEKLKQATHELLEAALNSGGSYYLTFDILATVDQFRRGYPRWREFFQLKQKYDPDDTFTSRFYQKYGTASAEHATS